MGDLYHGEVLITDLPERVSSGKMAATSKKGCWRMVDYKLEKIGKGRGLIGKQAGSELNGAEPITLHLGVEGYYRISFITRYGPIRAKLTGEKCFTVCEVVQEGIPKIPGGFSVEGWWDAEEVIWREAELTGKDLIIDHRELGTILLAIRLSPTRPKTDSAKVRWPMAFEAGVTLGERIYQSPDELFELFEKVTGDGCARVALWDCVSGDSCMYPTKVGTKFTDLTAMAVSGDVLCEHDRIFVKNVQQFQDWGIDPLKAVVDYAHGRGWELQVFIRYRNFHDAWPVEGLGASQFYLDHPQFRLTGPKGEPVMGLSVAYPEVRKHLCHLYAEMADYGVDGVCLGLNKAGHIALYEPPMVEAFKRRYEEDPRKLSELDPRWLDFMCDTGTTFMREVKKTLSSKCRLSCVVYGKQELNRRYGWDVPAWIREGIVDDVFLLGAIYLPWDIQVGGTIKDIDFNFFQNLPGREKVRLWPMFYMWQPFEADPEGQCSFLQDCLDKGADGYCLWDAPMHPIDLQANIWDLGKMPRPVYKKKNRLLGKYDLMEWDGYSWSRYTPLISW